MHHRYSPTPRRIALTSIALAVMTLAGQAAAQQAAADESATMQKVEVTGSSIKRVTSEMALPVTTVKADEMAKSAITTVADFVTSLSVGATNVPSSAGAGTNMNMRGIGINRTLVLLNGRRMVNEPLSNGFVNVDMIPMSALSRVEVLRDGASSTYGTDAIGGVTNFITKRTHNGFNITAQAVKPQAAGGATEQRVSLLGGIGNLDRDGWNLYATIDTHKRSPLESADRAELSSPELLARLGIAPKLGTGTYAFPANIFSPSTNITGNPYYSAGCNAQYSVPGTKNTCVQSANYVLALPGNGQTTFFAKGSLKLADDHMLTAELLLAKENITTQKAPTTTVGFNGAVAQITPASRFYPGGSGGVPAIAGLNGSTLNVSWSVAELGPAIARDEQHGTRLIVTDEGSFANWDYRLGFIYAAGERDSYFQQGYLNGPKLQAGVKDGTLNPFGKQDAAGLAYLQSISEDGGQIRHTTNRYTGLDLTLTRELATGAEYHHDENEDRSLDGVINVPYQNRMPSYAEGHRGIAAMFAELDVPLTNEINLNAAVRADRYSDFGGTVNPKFSFRYQPTKSLMFRGSASTGFRAPSLFDRYGYRLPGATTTTTAKWDDPLLCPGGTMGVPGTGKAVAGANPLLVCNANLPVQQGSNPDVLPEKSRNLTLGMVVEPVKDLMVSLDYFNIQVSDSIGQLAQNAIFTNTTRYADLFVRKADGSLNYLKNTVMNLGDMRTSGVDLGINYAFPRSTAGEFKLGLEGTYVTKFENQNEKDGPWISNLGRFGSIGSGNVSSSPTYTFRWKHTLKLNISTYSVWNAALAYKGLFKGVNLTVGVSNLFNTNPPITNSNATAYANNIASPIGRAYNARLSYDF